MKGGRQQAWVDPLQRPVPASSVTGTGTEVRVTPDADERARMATALGLAAIDRLEANYRLSARAGGIIQVTGEISAAVQPVCVVSLEAFPLTIREPVDLRFREEDDRPKASDPDFGGEDDPPDPIENGVIDLGRVTTEFLSLALPPFPRKPDAELSGSPAEAAPSPFDALAGFKPKGGT